MCDIMCAVIVATRDQLRRDLARAEAEALAIMPGPMRLN